MKPNGNPDEPIPTVPGPVPGRPAVPSRACRRAGLSGHQSLPRNHCRHAAPAGMAGAGSGYDSPRLDYLKRAFWNAGMHVIIMSSPTNHDFIAAASRSGLPGLGKDDARDLHSAMSLAVEHARIEKELEITDYRLAGFSLGALNAAFVAHLDQDLQQFNFSRTLLLNPPVDLYASIHRLEIGRAHV